MAKRTYTCADCGATETSTAQRGVLPKRCPDCKRVHVEARIQANKPNRVEVACQWCGNRFTPARSGNVFCSRKCNYASKVARARVPDDVVRGVCRECGGPRGKHKKHYCSGACRTAWGAKHREMKPSAYKKSEKAKAAARALYARTWITLRCGWCDHEFQTKPSVRVTCSDECRFALVTYTRRVNVGRPHSEPWAPHSREVAVVHQDPGVDAMREAAAFVSYRWNVEPRFVSMCCARCGLRFVYDRKVTTSPPVACSVRCKRLLASERRRARERDAYVSPVNRRKVYERDKFRCQICGGRLAMTKSVPHVKAPTIDHIIPLFAGGTHEMRNVQAAHFGCNSGKRDGQRNDQLLLIG